MTVRASPRERLRQLGDESGLTLVEALVGAIILVLGASAAFGVFAIATKNAQRAKASQVSLNLAQEEMERLRSVPYDDLGLTSLPTHSTNKLNPNHRVQGGEFALNKEPPGEYQSLVTDENGVSTESPYSLGGASGVAGTVYRYVVWRDDEECSEEDCPGEEDFKQLIVAVKPDTPGNQSGERGYTEVQSDLVDPETFPLPPEEEGGEGEEPPEGEGESVTAQQFFLSDTPCAKSGTTIRQEITEDHLLHNTLGTCASELQTESTLGAPDALLLSAPPDPDPLDPLNPPLYDYSDDSYIEPTPDTDRGLQIRRDETTGCHFDPTGSSHPESQVHRWVTDPMPFDFEMTEKATLEFSTRTLNDALHEGKLCVFLFERSEVGSPPEATDTFLTDKSGGANHWTYTPDGFWPRFAWARIRLTMFFNKAPYTIPDGNRLGVALAVERSKTEADAIPIMYDHPNYPSRLEIETETPIEGG